jgi:hypothetical protein
LEKTVRKIAKASQSREMEALVPAEAHGGGLFRPSWVFRTKEDWVAEKELLKEEHNVDMAVWLHKYQPQLPQSNGP